MNSSGKFSEALFNKNIKVWVSKSVAKLASEMPYYKELAHHEFTTDEMFSMLDGIERGEFVEVQENGRFAEEDDLPGFKTTYNQKDFGLVKRISYIAGRADASNHKLKGEAQRASALGRAYIRKMNKAVTDVIRNGFNTAFTSYGDGKPFFSTTHTRIDGGAATYRSNASSTGLALDESGINLEALLLQHRTSVDSGGEVVDYSESEVELWVPLALANVARKAVGVGLYAPGDNTFSPRLTDKVTVRVCPLLGALSYSAYSTGSDTLWFLKNKGMGLEEPIKVYHREGLKIDSWDDKDTRAMKTRGAAAFAIGWGDPVGKVTGSTGTGIAYSS